jgi:Smg protein
MFEVLVFVYEHYWRGDACPQWSQLERKLHAVGFESQEIKDALHWLTGLRQATRNTASPQSPATTDNATTDPSGQHAPVHAATTSMRVFSVAEQNRLGASCLGFIRFLEQAADLQPHMREIVVDRAMACGSDELGLEDLKIIVLMVYWSFGEEPDTLVLDELCDDARDRLAH